MEDSYAVLTPENVELTYTTAGLGSRFLALLIDTIIAGVLMVVVLLIGLGSAAGAAVTGGESAASAVYALVVIAVFLILFGYFIFFEGVWRGQTPGKRVLGIRVIRDDGLPENFTANVIRNVVRVVDALPGTYAVGVVAMFVSKRSKRLGDMAAGTLVVYDLPARGPQVLEATRVGDQTEGPGHHGRLSRREYGLVHDYLSRAPQLAPEARERIEQKLVALVELRTGVPRGAGSASEYLSAALARESDPRSPSSSESDS